ncbi:MAG TPA: hypothetical protein VGF34_09925 [Stellaceae bacterium]
MQGVARPHARRGSKFQTVNLGGLRLRSGEALIEWLEAGNGGPAAQAAAQDRVDETSIDYLENASRGDFCGARTMSRDVEGRWLDLHKSATGIKPLID